MASPLTKMCHGFCRFPSTLPAADAVPDHRKVGRTRRKRPGSAPDAVGGLRVPDDDAIIVIIVVNIVLITNIVTVVKSNVKLLSKSFYYPNEIKILISQFIKTLFCQQVLYRA